MTEAINAAAIIDKLYKALENKNLEEALACCTKDAVVWHCFDGVTKSISQVAEGWQGMFAQFSMLKVQDVRRNVVDGGIVQRHLFVMHSEDGEVQGKACCIFVRLEDGLIARIDEYISLTGELPITENGTTAGLSTVGQMI